MKEILIFGNTVLAKFIHYFFTRDSGFTPVGFTVDSSYNDTPQFCGLDVFDFETITETHPPSEYDLFIAIGPSRMNEVRENKFAEAKAKGYSMVSYISPNAVCDSPVGENTFVADLAVINPFTEIGNNCFFWEQSYVGNECVIGDNCYISPQASVGTYAKVANNSLLGTGATVNTCIDVAEKTLVGAGCYISQNTTENAVYGLKNSDFLGNISHKINIS